MQNKEIQLTSLIDYLTDNLAFQITHNGCPVQEATISSSDVAKKIEELQGEP